MTVVKVLELVGESTQGWQDAANQAVVEAARTVDNITGVEVCNWTANVDQGRITNYKANVRVAFVVDGSRRKAKV
ncbi:MAG: dodecin family protein [Bacillota bacterium]